MYLGIHLITSGDQTILLVNNILLNYIYTHSDNALSRKALINMDITFDPM